MKKKSILLIIISSCLGIGIVLMLVGLAMGANLTNSNFKSRFWTKDDTKNVSHELKNVSLTDTSDIKNLDFDLFAGDIEIVEGDSFSISGGKLATNKVENGTWKLSTSREKTILNFIHVKLPFFSDDDYDNDVTITIPANTTFSDVSLDLAAGEIKIEKLCADNINIQTSAGSTKADYITASKVDLDVSAGDINIGQFAISNSADIECNAGDIKLGNQNTVAQNWCNDLEADCSAGSLDIYGKLTGSSSIDVNMGDIELGLLGSKSNYDFKSASATLGKIKYKNEGTATDTSVFGELELDCTMGDIKVSFF